jgi:ankyrin repeat protein
MIESNHELNIVNSDHASLLIYATSLNNIDAVRLLVAKKINLDEVDKNGVTALHIAVQNGYKNIAALLVSMGARSDVKDTQGKSSAELANQQDDTEVKRLIPTKSIKAIFPPTKLPILQKKS